MGYRQDSHTESNKYRQKLYELGEKLVHRLVTPWLHSNFMFKILGYKADLDTFLEPVHNYTAKIIDKRRSEFIMKDQNIHDIQENM